MIITPEMVERGKRALHEKSTYRGYNQETLDREYIRMEQIYEAHVRAVLAAAIGDFDCGYRPYTPEEAEPHIEAPYTDPVGQMKDR